MAPTNSVGVIMVARIYGSSKMLDERPEQSSVYSGEDKIPLDGKERLLTHSNLLRSSVQIAPGPMVLFREDSSIIRARGGKRV